MVRTLDKLDVKGKKAIVRVDFNVPIEGGKVTNDKRIRESMPTINYLLERNCKVILMSHLGKPQKELKKGKAIDEIKKKLTLRPIADKLSEVAGRKAAFVNDCVDVILPDEKIVLLENLRFHPEEEKNDINFARKLASYADFYINDAFGTCHRAHASVHAITQLLPSAGGLLLQKEVENLGRVIGNVQKPFMAIIGGAKEDKIGVIKSLIPKVDKIIIAGILANTFLKVKGMDIGASKFDEESEKVAHEIIDMAGSKLILPVDSIIADKFDNEANKRSIRGNILAGWMILDVGQETIRLYENILKDAKTIVWGGPLGVFEFDNFANGTLELARFIAGLKATTIIGGGDSAAAIEKFGLERKMTHVSTGGGASLEFIEKEGKLPAIIALEENFNKFP